MLKTKFILTLILILFLIFTLIGDCDWLSGWDYRIELKIEDYAGDIGAEVTWFPATVFLTAAKCEEVFVELTTDAEYLKVAFTKADGVTELYGECELFDVSETKGIFHVSRDGWVINANTSVFMYYDKDHADNTTYIGAITTKTEVWDGNYKLVCHMVDDNGNVDDSTSNNNDGTKKGAGEPAEVTGHIGQGQSFDGTDDYIDCGDIDATALTLETWGIHGDTSISDEGLISKYNTNYEYSFYFTSDNLFLIVKDTGGTNYIGRCDSDGSGTPADTNPHYYVATYDGGTTSAAIKIYIDTVQVDDANNEYGEFTAMANTADPLWIGCRGWGGASTDCPWYGVQDEVRISNIVRPTAWQLGTYNSGNDSLFTYGSEEEAPVEGANIMFLFSDF